MPEIVEHRVDADFLDFYISNRVMTSIKFLSDLFKNKCSGIEELNAELPLTVQKVVSKAKKICIHLTNDKEEKKDWWIFICHGMSGSISEELKKHSHIQIDMAEHKIGLNTWYINNVRRIGSCQAMNDEEKILENINDMSKPIVLGYPEYDNFEPITSNEIHRSIKKAGKKYLAAALMDQRTICSGIGNYLLSEIFYEAKLKPFVRCNELSKDQINQFIKASEKVILESYSYGGVSMSDYIHIDGEKGTYENRLKVYGNDKKYIDGKKIQCMKGPHNRNIWYIE